MTLSGLVSSKRGSFAARSVSASEARADGSAEEFAPFGDHAEGRGGAEVDGDARPAVELVGRHGVGDAVGAQLPRVFILDVDARPDARLDLHRLDAEVVPAHVLHGEVDLRHHRRHHDAVDLAAVDAVVLQKVHQQKAQLVRRALAVGGDAPVLTHLHALAQRGLDVGVADVQRENHGRSPPLFTCVRPAGRPCPAPRRRLRSEPWPRPSPPRR